VVGRASEIRTLAITDLDPAAMAIAQDLVVSFRRNFEIERARFEVYKVALTLKQVRTKSI
jgi:16S rRNA C1402 N4-methylase RsmH